MWRTMDAAEIEQKAWAQRAGKAYCWMKLKGLRGLHRREMRPRPRFFEGLQDAPAGTYVAIGTRDSQRKYNLAANSNCRSTR